MLEKNQVENEQNGNIKAEYGKQILKKLSKELRRVLGSGFSVSNLQYMRSFYLEYPKQQTVSRKLSWSHYCELLRINNVDERNFYEKECINSNWSVRELNMMNKNKFRASQEKLFIIQ